MREEATELRERTRRAEEAAAHAAEAERAHAETADEAAGAERDLRAQLAAARAEADGAAPLRASLAKAVGEADALRGAEFVPPTVRKRTTSSNASSVACSQSPPGRLSAPRSQHMTRPSSCGPRAQGEAGWGPNGVQGAARRLSILRQWTGS